MSPTTWFWMLIMPGISLSSKQNLLKCPSAPAKCVDETTSNDQEYSSYSVNGLTMNVQFVINKNIEYDCTNVILTIDDYSLPKFELLTPFENVSILNCGPPTNPYSTALDTLNITNVQHLSFTFQLCANETFTPKLFSGLELQALTIKCDAFDMTSHVDFSFLKPLGSLKHLALKGMVIPSLPPWNRVRSIEFIDIAPVEESQAWGECSELEELSITNYEATLPDGWLSNCSRLTTLHLYTFTNFKSPLQMVASDYLKELRIIDSQIQELPRDLFLRAKNLRVLDLSNNLIMHIDRQHFSSISLLEELDLKYNYIEHTALAEFKPLKHLQRLYLDLSISSDSCQLTTDQNEVINPWPSLPTLQHLSLIETGATKICKEWSESLPSLEFIDLRDNSITELRYRDVQLIRASGWTVDMRSDKFQAIVYDERDYVDAMENVNQTQYNSTIWIDSPRVCDCYWYWLSQVLKKQPNHILMPNLTCQQQWGKSGGYVPFTLMAPEEFICKIECEQNCKCYIRAQDNTTQVNCTDAGLARMPHVPLLREIHLMKNNIELTAHDFPPTLEYMDLRYNRLSAVDPEIASMMFSRRTMLYRLGGNHIDCFCNNSALITALQTYEYQVLDYENVLCENRLPIRNFSIINQCIKEYAPIVGSGLGFIALFVLIIFAVYYGYRKEINIMLYARGWCTCCVNEKELDKDKKYDVFISFAYEDSSIVMDELVPTLENEPNPFTVCIHQRDWEAGDWIPLQIARSVEESRRTIIVLSKNFLSSVWALLEFRTAHEQALKDKRVRLIIVLIDDVIKDQNMDDEMRAYLTTNTYIKWGDPRFWEKLMYALPHCRRDESRFREAGEEVVRRTRPSDPPTVLRDGAGSEMLCIEPANNTRVQTAEG